MAQTKNTVATTYNDYHKFPDRDDRLSLGGARHKGWLEGWQAHGAEKPCGSEACACLLEGRQRGKDEVLEDPEFFGLASPSRGSKV